MELGKYKQAMRPKKYLTREFVVYKAAPEAMDDVVQKDRSYESVMPSQAPAMDNYMPEIPGMEDPSLRQVELADGGVVQREGFWKGSSLFKFADKIKKYYLEGKSSKEINKLLGFKNDRTTTIDDLIKSLKDPTIDTPISIKPEEFQKRPVIIGANQFKQTPYARDEEIYNRIKKAATGGKETVTEFIKNNPDLNRTTVFLFLKNNNIKFKKVEQGAPSFSKKVTSRIKELEKIIKDNPNASPSQLADKFPYPVNLYNSTLSALKKSYKNAREGFTPNLSLKERVLKLKDNIPTNFEENIFNLMKKYNINPDLLDKEVLKKITRSRRAVGEFFNETNFEHNFSKQLLEHIDDPNKKLELLLTGGRTTPELNQFKKRYDNLLNGLVNRYKSGEISLNQYNQQTKQIVEEFKKITGGYDIGYIKFDSKGKAIPVVKTKPIYEGSKIAGPEITQRASTFENIKYHNNLIKNYNKNPNANMFNTLRDTVSPEKAPVYLDLEKSWNKVSSLFKGSKKQFMDYASKNLDNPVVQALFKKPYGQAALVTGASIVPGALSAEEINAVEEINNQIDVPEQKGLNKTQAGVLAGAGTVATKTGRKILGKILDVIGTPLTVPLSAAGVGKALDPEKSYGEHLKETVTDPYFVSGTGFLMKPTVESSKNIANLVSKFSPAAGKVLEKGLNIGMNPNVLSKFGTNVLGPVAGLYAAGKELYDLYSKNKDYLDSLTQEERDQISLNYLDETTMDVFKYPSSGEYIGGNIPTTEDVINKYAYGGRVNFKKGRDPTE